MSDNAHAKSLETMVEIGEESRRFGSITPKRAVILKSSSMSTWRYSDACRRAPLAASKPPWVHPDRTRRCRLPHVTAQLAPDHGLEDVRRPCRGGRGEGPYHGPGEPGRRVNCWDLGGYQAKPEASSGPIRLYKFDSLLDPDASHPYPLRLRFRHEDQATNPTLLTISYHVNSRRQHARASRGRIRHANDGGDAKSRTDLSVTPTNKVDFTVSYQRFEATYALNISFPHEISTYPNPASPWICMLLVICTIGALLAFWAVAYRATASLIRVESSRLLHQERTKQSIHAMTALDRALTLLEVSKPPSDQTFTYSLDLTLPDGTHKLFTVSFRANNNLSGASNGWTVRVTPGSSGVNLALPKPGDEPQWPASPPL